MSHPRLAIAVTLASLLAIGLALWNSPGYGLVMVLACLAGGWIIGGALHEIKGGDGADTGPHSEG